MFKLDLIIMAPLQMKTDCATKLSFCFFHYVTISQWQTFPNIVQKVLFKDFILYAHENEGAHSGFESSLSVRVGIATEAVSRSIKINFDGTNTRHLVSKKA